VFLDPDASDGGGSAPPPVAGDGLGRPADDTVEVAESAGPGSAVTVLPETLRLQLAMT
jgi:hypothetical protein